MTGRRRIAIGAAVSGSGAGLLGAGGYGLLRVEALLARRAIPALSGAPLASGVYGDGEGPPLRLVMIGDSAAAGVGATVPAETPGALLATALATHGQRPVALDVVAVSGARSSDLEPQVSRAQLHSPHVAVLSIGANDVTHRVGRAAALGEQEEAVRRLLDGGARVVVTACPDLGAVRPIPQPLRAWARRLSLKMSDAQVERLTAAGATVVPMGRSLGPVFADDPTLFCDDRFHPSAAGYRLLADGLLPAVLAAAELGPPVEGGTSTAGAPA